MEYISSFGREEATFFGKYFRQKAVAPLNRVCPPPIHCEHNNAPFPEQKNKDIIHKLFCFTSLPSDFLAKIAYISCFLDLLYTLTVGTLMQKPTLFYKRRHVSIAYIFF